MNNKFLRFLLTGSAIAIASTFACQNRTTAQTIPGDVPFSGDIPDLCYFIDGTVVPGILGYDATNTKLTSNSANSGINGSISVLCNGAAGQLSIQNVTPATTNITAASTWTAGISATDVAPSSMTVTATNAPSVGNIPIPNNNIPATYYVGLETGFASAPAAGTYTYTVNLALNP